MKTVRISDDVYEEIGKRGKFGENADDVLRRVFGIGQEIQPIRRKAEPTPKMRIATIRMKAKIMGRNLFVEFENGQKKHMGSP